MVRSPHRITRLFGAVRAELAIRRAVARGLSPPAPTLRAGLARRPGLQLSAVPPRGRGAAGRRQLEQCAPRRRRNRQPRLLDRRAVRAPGLHDRGSAPHALFRLRKAAALSRRGGLPAAQYRQPAAAAQKRFPRGGLCPPIPIDRRQMAGPRAVRVVARGLDQNRRRAARNSGAAGFAGQRHQVDAELGQRELPFLGLVRAEHDVFVGVDAEPAIGLQLGVELAGTPAGIAQRQQAFLRPAALADGAQNLERGGERDIAAHHQRAVLDVIGGMQHETAPDLDRAAEMDLCSAFRAGALDAELPHQIRPSDVVQQPVDHQPHCAVGIVRADVDHRAREARILHLRHGDQKMAGKRGHDILLPQEISAALDAGKRGKRIIALVLGIFMFAAAAPAMAQDPAPPWFSTDKGRVRFFAPPPRGSARASVRLGLQFELAPHWKIYWRSPGDAGYPPRLDWSGSKNLADAVISWPAPQRFSVLGLETMGYTDAVVLPITARLIENGNALSLVAALDYLTCNDICIPYQAKLRLDLPSGAAPAGAQGYAALIAQYQALVPGNGDAAGLKLLGAAVETGARPALLLRLHSDQKLIQPDAFIEGAGEVDFAAPVTLPGETPGETVLRLAAEGKSSAIAELAGQTLTVTLVDGARAMEGNVTPVLAPASSPGLHTWLIMLALALAGGLILNFMPCVLPVLAVKLLAAVTHREQGSRAVRAGFLASAAGILAAFLGLAVFAVGLRLAGLYAGWGLQFQSPLLLGVMIVLLLVFAANLWGLYQIPLPGFVAALGERKALLGSFGAGVR